MHLAVAGISVLAGSALTVAVLLLAGWRQVPVHRYEVTVALEVKATTAQRDTVRGTLAKALPGEDVQVVTREEQFEEFRRKWEADNGELPDSVTPALMNERLKISVSARTFDCDTLAGVHADAAVDSLSVDRVHGGTGLRSAIVCRR
ncbi:permease-like cell division protein FtsX [Actinoplanes utahensis]|uniref:FtsX extracellular domain-containing protein n=1 Tax=Actinoplanes utahensis TaxID=1869 RepID=A0A0A6UK76_ACTUT|nr:permease-like cell division protein FtsX [Actinoplanes utahensis]KHD75821.1 hypothetical protein MB27_20500 [Actinoplanes utahensis]